jgi:hypothetical protein
MLSLGTTWRRVISTTPLATLSTVEGVSRTHWMGGWVGLRAGLVSLEKKKLLPVQGIEPHFLSLHPVAHCYTDRTILAHFGVRKS